MVTVPVRGESASPVQFLQLVCLGASWNVPAAHDTHVASPTTGAIVPGLHSLGVTLPVLQLWPSVQLVHCEALARVVAEVKVPAGQGSAADAPSGQNEPWSHASQLAWPPAAW